MRNFQDFIMRNGLHYDCFENVISKIYELTEGIRQDNKICFEYISYMDRMFIMNMLILNAEVLRIELKKSLTDMRYRYPRCSHFKMKVTHSLFVRPHYYLESTDKDYVRFFICDDCKDYIYFCDDLWGKFYGCRRCNGINIKNHLCFEAKLDELAVFPLRFSMY